MFTKINLITPPDSMFNTNLSYLLVKPSTEVQVEFQKIITQIDADVNVFMYNEVEPDIGWLLHTSQQADIVIIDIDNCDSTTLMFLSLLLIHPNAFYFTKQDNAPWGILSKNRIYNFDWMLDIPAGYEDDED